LKNAELFSQQINEIEDREVVLEIKKALGNAKNLYNLIRLYGHFDLLERVDFRKLTELYNEAAKRLDLLNLKASLQNDVDTTNLINVALEDIIFMFRKVSEGEMIIADQLKDTLRKTRETLANNFDQQDPEFVSLYDELRRLFKDKNLDEITQEDMKRNIAALQQIYDRITELNRKNNLLKAKYENDAKYVRTHKRIMERGTVSTLETEIHEALVDIKNQVDDRILINRNLLNNEAFFQGIVMPDVIKSFGKTGVTLDVESARYINNCLVKEYVSEYIGA
jgi:type I restriction enzyme R subunit